MGKTRITGRLDLRICSNPVPRKRGFMARKLKTYQTSLGFFDPRHCCAIDEGGFASLELEVRELCRRRWWRCSSAQT